MYQKHEILKGKRQNFSKGSFSTTICKINDIYIVCIYTDREGNTGIAKPQTTQLSLYIYIHKFTSE